LLWLIGLVAVVAALTTTVLVSPPAFVRSWFAAEGRPSPRAGNPVPPIRGEPIVRLAVAGDTGTGGPAQLATARRMVAESRAMPYDALLLLGDMIYEDGDAELVDDRVLDPFGPLLEDGTELLPALGNHDYESGEQRKILTALDRKSSWYVERVGPVRVLVLDSNRVKEAAQTEWLSDQLATPQAAGTWTIASMHHPAFSAGHHGSDADVQRVWAPLFAEYEVPLVLAGHDHDYQRSLPQDGVTYVVSGAGAKLRKTGHEDFTAVSTSTLHFLDLLVYDSRIVGRAIDHQGRLLDIFTVRP
jgi:3',5'-cyclic AMP phosphodiesterase CpdA